MLIRQVVMLVVKIYIRNEVRKILQNGSCLIEGSWAVPALKHFTGYWATELCFTTSLTMPCLMLLRMYQHHPQPWRLHRCHRFLFKLLYHDSHSMSLCARHKYAFQSKMLKALQC